MADPKNRISAKLREAVRLMVEDGLTRSKAAENAGMTDHGLYSALRKPHVRALRRQMVGDLRESVASQTIGRIDNLAQSALSEHVRLEANKHLASLDPDTSPVQRNETTHRFDGPMGPGLTIILMQPAAQPSEIIDGDAINRPAQLTHLPDRVPHPNERHMRLSGVSMPLPLPSTKAKSDAK